MVTAMTIDDLLIQRARSGDSEAIRDILAAAAAPGMLSMAGGLPAPDSFPVREIATASQAVLADCAVVAMQYAPTEGVPAMRETIARLATSTGAPVGIECAMVTSGSQQGLDLVARTLLDEGDLVALEDPGYLGAVQTFQQAGARLLAVPGDRDGMDVEALAASLDRGARCKLVYVVPHFHNPTGSVMSVERRGRLAELAERYGFLIVEDDPYAELAFDGARLPSINVHTDRVVRLMSLSKSVCPGFRVAGLVAPARLLVELANTKQCVDLQTNTFGQHVLARVLDEPGFLPRHVQRLQTLYRQRANALAAVLRDRLPWLAFDRPRGGLFFWCAMGDPGVTSGDLARAALAAGVAIVPGEPFCVERDGSRHFRLSYATLDHAEMCEATSRLATAFTSIRKTTLRRSDGK